MSRAVAAVLVVAGRRIDRVDAKQKQFPLGNVNRVRTNLRRVFFEHRIVTVVASAACGADLLTLDTARDAGVPFIVVIPHSRERFKSESVTDRPGDWADLYESLIDDATRRNALIIVNDEQNPFHAATREIVDEAQRLAAARQVPLLALAVWDGRRRGPDDYTAAFIDLARAAGANVLPFIETN